METKPIRNPASSNPVSVVLILPLGDSNATAWIIPGRAGMYPYGSCSRDLSRCSRESDGRHTGRGSEPTIGSGLLCRVLLTFHHRQESRCVAGTRPQNLGRLWRFMDQLPERRPDRGLRQELVCLPRRGIRARSEKWNYRWNARTVPSTKYCKFDHFQFHPSFVYTT